MSSGTSLCAFRPSETLLEARLRLSSLIQSAHQSRGKQHSEARGRERRTEAAQYNYSILPYHTTYAAAPHCPFSMLFRRSIRGCHARPNRTPALRLGLSAPVIPIQPSATTATASSIAIPASATSLLPSSSTSSLLRHVDFPRFFHSSRFRHVASSWLDEDRFPFQPPPRLTPDRDLTTSGSTNSSGRSGVEAYFGCDVFDRRTMKKFLSSVEFDKFSSAVREGKGIDFATADAIAQALMRWATERGASHFTHWFQPITGTCAEKHDTFLDVLRDGETPLTRFTGKQLIMGEPDGSSFPSGGLRATHVARGYTAWDPHSPPFLLQQGHSVTLYIPSCFFSWDHGYALDEKIPLLRSEVALARESMRLFQVLGETKHTRVHMDAGLEQEFFLIDRKFYMQRPDLMLTGRTLFGAAPPKGQELEDQYFGPVSSRYLECLHDFEVSCWRAGIPIQTRHREVAPGQYEIAPKFAPAHVGTDRNLLLMEILKRTARKHGLAALLHEKPFARLNGSGKHNNWSLGTNETPSLLDPGLVPEKNVRFMLFLAATLAAVDKHADLMRVAISGVGNDHRLGANEAPPAIVSAYLGDDIEKSLERFIGGSNDVSEFNTNIDLGIGALPDLRRVQTDRNRTSTFAFTGNKFEFRAVGASQNPARSNTVLNTIVAESVKDFADEIEKLRKSGMSAHDAMVSVARDALKRHKRIIFNGNGYSQEWADEARRRGLPNLRSTPDALDTLYSEKNIALFEGMKVLTRQELKARSNILFEDYTKRILIEGRVVADVALTKVVPAAIDYQLRLGGALQLSEGVVGADGAAPQRKLLTELTNRLSDLMRATEGVKRVCDAAHDQGSVEASAHYLQTHLIPLMNDARQASDALESIIPADQWPLPTYHHMLFHQD